MPTDPHRRLHLTTRCPDDSLKASGKGVIGMPGYDETGPECAGPMTGGRHGWCARENDGRGIGYGRALGGGRGRRNRRQARGGSAFQNAGDGRFGNRSQSAFPKRRDDETLLKQAEQQAAMMQQRLDTMHARIESLKARPPERQ